MSTIVSYFAESSSLSYTKKQFCVSLGKFVSPPELPELFVRVNIIIIRLLNPPVKRVVTRFSSRLTLFLILDNSTKHLARVSLFSDG